MVPLHLLLRFSTILKEISQTFQANELKIISVNRMREYTKISAEFLSLGCSTYASVETSERDGLFVFTDIIEVRDCLLQRHAVDCLGRFAGVFEVDSKVGAASFGGLGRVD